MYSGVTLKNQEYVPLGYKCPMCFRGEDKVNFNVIVRDGKPYFSQSTLCNVCRRIKYHKVREPKQVKVVRKLVRLERIKYISKSIKEYFYEQKQITTC